MNLLLKKLFTATFFQLLACLIITFPHNFAIATTIDSQKTILILGDSLSAGYGIPHGKNWTDLLEKKLAQENPNVHLVNASISGDTTANGLNRLSSVLKQYSVDIIIIELGGNDGLRGLPINHIRKNLEALIKTSLGSGAQVAIMEINIPPNYGKKYTQALKQLYPELANQYSITLLPFFIRDIALQPELMQSDGIHPNEQAQALIMEQMWPAIHSLIKPQ